MLNKMISAANFVVISVLESVHVYLIHSASSARKCLKLSSHKSFYLLRVANFVVISVLLSGASMAAEPINFALDHAKSKIQFEAIQNGAPVNGEFKTFEVEIAFSPNNLAASKVSTDVALASVASSYDEMSETLKGAEWFDVQKFPQAKFISRSFTKEADGTYTANGDLTIRDKTNPTQIKFVLKEFGEKHAIIDGTVNLKLNSFGVGQGEWASTSAVKDDVKVTIHLEASAK